MNIRLLLLVPIIILSACATPKSTTAPFQEVKTIPSNSAIVYFYRPEAKFNYAGWAELFINGEKKFPLVNNSYGYALLDEGEYEIKFEGSTWSTNWWPGPAEARLSVMAGGEYYIRMEPLEPGSTVGTTNWGTLVLITETFSNYSKAQTEIRQVEKSEALIEIRSTTLVKQ